MSLVILPFIDEVQIGIQIGVQIEKLPKLLLETCFKFLVDYASLDKI